MSYLHTKILCSLLAPLFIHQQFLQYTNVCRVPTSLLYTMQTLSAFRFYFPMCELKPKLTIEENPYQLITVIFIILRYLMKASYSTSSAQRQASHQIHHKLICILFLLQPKCSLKLRAISICQISQSEKGKWNALVLFAYRPIQPVLTNGKHLQIWQNY